MILPSDDDPSVTIEPGRPVTQAEARQAYAEWQAAYAEEGTRLLEGPRHTTLGFVERLSIEWTESGTELMYRDGRPDQITLYDNEGRALATISIGADGRATLLI